MASSPADEKQASAGHEGSSVRAAGQRPAGPGASGALAEPASSIALICPRCCYRTSVPPEEPPPSRAPASLSSPTSARGRRREVPRCPNDGVALVSPEVLAEADGDPFLGATIAERFVILGKLGAGSMGTVYRARQEAMGRDVAIKILRSDRAFDAHAKARFTREARATSLLTSPHTVTVFDFGEIVDDSPDADLGLGTGGSLYLAMEMLEGESLGQRLKRLKRLPVADAVRFARHALLSLAEAHEKGIIHRDLKPDNLFLSRPPTGEQEEICKVLDFGIAKVMSDGGKAVDALETQAGTVFGTPRYMSPEQAQGKPLDPRSDLYSLGVLLYQMLVGRPPFVDDDAVVVMARHIKSTPVSAAEAAPDAAIPRALSEFLQRVLSKTPDGRPSSAMAFIEEMERALAARDRDPQDSERGAEPRAGEGTGALLAVVGDGLDSAQAPGARRPAPRSRLPLIAALAAILIGAGVLAASLRPGAPARDAQAYVAREARARVEAVGRSPGSLRDEPTDASAPAPDDPPGEASSARPERSGGAPSPTSAASEPTAPAPGSPRRKAPSRKPYEKFK